MEHRDFSLKQAPILSPRGAKLRRRRGFFGRSRNLARTPHISRDCAAKRGIPARAKSAKAGAWGGACSSAWLEPAAHNGWVAGSTPAGPTNYPVSWRIRHKRAVCLLIALLTGGWFAPASLAQTS